MDEPNQIPPSSSGATRSVKKKREMDPFYNIVWHGDVDYFKQVPVDVLLNSRDVHGDSILSKAVIQQYISCVKVIYERCPELLYCQNKYGRHALHHAAGRSNLEILKFIINADVESQGSGANERLTRMQDNDGNVALMDAVKPVMAAKKVELLITADPEFNPPPNHEGETPLKWCMSLSRWCMSDFGMQDTFKLLLMLAPNQSKTHMGSDGWTILHYAASEGDLSTLKDILRYCPDCSEVVDNNGQNFLHIATRHEQVDLCKMICTKCPSLVYHQSRDGKTPLHHAAWRGDAKMVGLLLSAGAKWKLENKGDIENQVDTNNNTKLLMMVDELGDTALHIAVSKRKLEAAKLLIEADRDVPYDANKAGETPLSIAILEARSNQDRFNTGRIRKLLLKMQTSQSIAPIGENDWTLLHFAASYDDVNAVREIIEFCPDDIELVDEEGMNFLHVAAKYKSIQVVKHTLGGRKIPYSVLNKQDYNGNTPLHLAALSGDERLTVCFLYDHNVDKTTVNNDGQYVLHAINFDYDKGKAGVDIVVQLDQDLKDQRNFDLVVGALIATVSFTAGVTVPGGYISDGPNEGTAVLSKEMTFQVFVISNTFALLFSLYAVFSHYCARRLHNPQYIRYQLKVATYCTLGALYAMMAAFISGSFAILANSSRLAILVCAIGCCFYICSICPMWKIVMEERGGSTGWQWRLKFGGWWELLGRGRAVRNPSPSRNMFDLPQFSAHQL